MGDEDRPELIERPPTATEYRRLRRAVGWNDLEDASIELGLAGARYSCVLAVDADVVGCGRVVGDGGLYFYLQDVIVLPELQGRGLGAAIMDAILRYLDEAAAPGAFVGLMAAQGAEGFYRRYGFERRPDDRPGMFRVW